MTYIKRDIESKIIALSKEYSCILVTGPRQVGKTTLLKQLMDDDLEYVALYDTEDRRAPSSPQSTVKTLSYLSG